jgi:hypothetical protein
MGRLAERRAMKRAAKAQYLHDVQVTLAVAKILRREHDREIRREARRWIEMQRLAVGGQMVRELSEDGADQAIEARVQPHGEPGQEGSQKIDRGTQREREER